MLVSGCTISCTFSKEMSCSLVVVVVVRLLPGVLEILIVMLCVFI